MYTEIYWWDIPEVKNAYYNGKDFTGVDLTNVCFIHEKTVKEIVLLELTGANFKGCDLSSTVFCGADVCGADFTEANLEGCEFYCCYFGYEPQMEIAPNIRYNVMIEGFIDDKLLYTVNNIRMPLDFDGQELICYKALSKHHFMRNSTLAIAKLLVPSDARRIVFKNDKCRAERVKVLDIYSPDKKFYYKTAHPLVMGDSTLYKVGKEVCADSFDIATCMICAHGIHFFLTEEEAIEFGKRYMRK